VNSIRYKISAFAGKTLIFFLEKIIALFVKNDIYLDVQKFEWIKNIEENAHLIQAEFDAFCKQQYEQIPDICAISEEQYQVVKKDEWKFIPLYTYGIKIHSFASFFPNTIQLINTIPDFTTVFFSMLQPHTKIASHRGAYKGYLRYHLGVKIPDDFQKCGINIQGKIYHWQNGKSVVFDDTFEHFAWNDSDELRTVLYVDFIRPMPKFLKLISKWLTTSISKSLFVQNAIKKINNFEKDSNLVKILG